MNSIMPDKALQDIVYKLVPGLYHSEMKRRQEFYQKHPHRDMHLQPECRGVSVDRIVYTADELISLSLEYYDKYYLSIALNHNPIIKEIRYFRTANTQHEYKQLSSYTFPSLKFLYTIYTLKATGPQCSSTFNPSNAFPRTLYISIRAQHGNLGYHYGLENHIFLRSSTSRLLFPRSIIIDNLYRLLIEVISNYIVICNFFTPLKFLYGNYMSIV
ncbi:polycomb group protein Psc-like [Aphis craccivora]|uniref:Polycomb group protein Psc-like n=1 Tax=Aphis craccivora TaxID=307492 RepID=A0A6G0YW22_APHCR|nr:polycomb group protein Psc-like [Aphis craccivora]